MKNKFTRRGTRLIVSLATAGLLATVGGAPAAAHPPLAESHFLPPAACNQGTENAHATVPPSAPAHPRIPHRAPVFLGGACHHNPRAP